MAATTVRTVPVAVSSLTPALIPRLLKVVVHVLIQPDGIRGPCGSLRQPTVLVTLADWTLAKLVFHQRLPCILPGTKEGIAGAELASR